MSRTDENSQSDTNWGLYEMRTEKYHAPLTFCNDQFPVPTKVQNTSKWTLENPSLLLFLLNEWSYCISKCVPHLIC